MLTLPAGVDTRAGETSGWLSLLTPFVVVGGEDAVAACSVDTSSVLFDVARLFCVTGTPSEPTEEGSTCPFTPAFTISLCRCKDSESIEKPLA